MQGLDIQKNKYEFLKTETKGIDIWKNKAIIRISTRRYRVLITNKGIWYYEKKAI